MWSSSFVIYSPTTKRSTGQLSGKSGSYYGGKMNNLMMTGKFNINRFFQFDLSYEFNHILFPKEYSISGSEALFKSNLLALNLKIQANSKLSIKTLVQYDDMSNSFGSNLRFRYNPREGTDFFVVINHGINTLRRPEQLPSPELPMVARQSVIFKFIRTFDFNRN
ncbi:MAG: hypothetical protein M3Q58_11405 [Bacteroidota bacterium]|nr:hypothetical protein [Bacteroidota bacterium]